MDIKHFVNKTLEDTIGFFKVYGRMLESLRDKTESEERRQGVQDAIDMLEEFCQTGVETAELYINKRTELLHNKMQDERPDFPAIEACGPEKKKLN